MPYIKNGQISNSNNENTDTLLFLGHQFTKHEYEEACSNLEDFFKILIKWQKKEGLNEKETNL
ncbi:MAG: hypothetical protein DRP35_09055 [Candidatus Zixiibacteriota bacterium]|nr:MAG: hypothetical protein DRP35_09055 [candidate division Zixibacteria bacterium]